MKITLKRAFENDCERIHTMQKSAFQKLLDKYHDYDTNPASESLETIKSKMRQNSTEYFFIMLEEKEIGVARIVTIDNSTRRISPIFVLPEYQNKGYAQTAMKLLEKMHTDTCIWRLETIKQEEKLCYLYEKLDYISTGEETQIKDGMAIVYYEKTFRTDNT